MTVSEATPTRQRLLAFIKAHIARTGQSPTIREMGEGAGISSTSVVHYHLKALEKLGLVEREPNTIRGIRTNERFSACGKADDQDRRKAMGGRAKHSISDLRPHAPGCMLCGAGDVPLELDHFYPLARGGVDADYNWIVLCQDCNRKKSDREPVSFVLENYSARELQAIIEFLLRADDRA